jgi:hypothetical protein
VLALLYYQEISDYQHYNQPLIYDVLHARYNWLSNVYVRIKVSPYMETNVSDTPSPAPVTPLNPRRRGIIVGASDGLGAALARKLAREGYTLALLARRKEKLESLCKEINLSLDEQRTLAYMHDVADHDKVPDLLRKIVADLGGLDLIVFVAGVNYPPGGD